MRNPRAKLFVMLFAVGAAFPSLAVAQGHEGTIAYDYDRLCDYEIRPESSERHYEYQGYRVSPVGAGVEGFNPHGFRTVLESLSS